MPRIKTAAGRHAKSQLEAPHVPHTGSSLRQAFALPFFKITCRGNHNTALDLFVIEKLSHKPINPSNQIGHAPLAALARLCPGSAWLSVHWRSMSFSTCSTKSCAAAEAWRFFREFEVGVAGAPPFRWFSQNLKTPHRTRKPQEASSQLELWLLS